MEKTAEALTKNTEKMLEVEHDIMLATAKFRKQLDAYKAKDAELKEALYKAMEKSGVKNYENDLIKLTFISPTTRRTFDAKAFESDYPDLAEDYKKESPVKGSVRITVKTVTKRVEQ